MITFATMKEQDSNSPIIHLQQQQLLLRMEYEYEKEVRINLCLKHHNAKMFNSFHASEELVEDAENGGFRIMPTVEEGCLDYKKKENED